MNRKEPGRIHICSKSIIFEPDLLTLPIYRYNFFHFEQPPALGSLSLIPNLTESSPKLI